MTKGSTPLFLDKIAKLLTDMKQQAAESKQETDERIEAMQTEMTTLIEGLAQMQRLNV
jgi:hypothetical protein